MFLVVPTTDRLFHMPLTNATWYEENTADRQQRHLRERAFLTNAVCREIQASDGDYDSQQVRTAVTMFQRWITEEFGLPDGESIRFRHGLDELDDVGTADTIREIQTGADVFQDVQLFWWADSAMESARYAEKLSASLAMYFSTRSASER